MASRRPQGARQSRPRSQHFLRTRRLAAELVRGAGVAPGDLVLEIGAGTGRLTEQLARVADRVVAIENDPSLVRCLLGRWTNVTVVQADAATVPLPDEPFQVVSNLPFSRTSDLLGVLLDDPHVPLIRADVVVQWDVAVRRGLPWPSSLKGVVWGAFYEASVARRLPRSAFVPCPSVDAGVLVMRRRRTPLVPVDRGDAYRRFVAAGFRHGLARVLGRRTAGGEMRGRAARDLDAHEWAALFDASARSGRRRT